LTALTVTQLFRLRWRIELFFKWIKQHLRIEELLRHLGQRRERQVWIAISTYVMVAIMRKTRNRPGSLHNSTDSELITFEKVLISEALTASRYDFDDTSIRKQLQLFPGGHPNSPTRGHLRLLH